MEESENIVHSIQNEVAYDFIRKEVIDYIEKNYSEHATLNELSKILHLDHAYLSRLIKKITGKNFQVLLLNYRIEIAKIKLLSGFKVYVVAEQVGFNNPAHFSQMFKKCVGVSPSKYC